MGEWHLDLVARWFMITESWVEFPRERAVFRRLAAAVQAEEVEVTADVQARLGELAILETISDFELFSNRAFPTFLSDIDFLSGGFQRIKMVGDDPLNDPWRRILYMGYEPGQKTFYVPHRLERPSFNVDMHQWIDVLDKHHTGVLWKGDVRFS